VPAIIASDREAQFTSTLWTALFNLHNIGHSPATAFHPQIEQTGGALPQAALSLYSVHFSPQKGHNTDRLVSLCSINFVFLSTRGAVEIDVF
jgi:hypothetical protein